MGRLAIMLAVCVAALPAFAHAVTSRTVAVQYVAAPEPLYYAVDSVRCCTASPSIPEDPLNSAAVGGAGVELGVDDRYVSFHVDDAAREHVSAPYRFGWKGDGHPLFFQGDQPPRLPSGLACDGARVRLPDGVPPDALTFNVDLSPTANVPAAGCPSDSQPVAGTVTFQVEQPDPAVLVDESGGSTVVHENGTHDTYQLALSRKPTADVRVRVLSDGEELQVFTFRAAEWYALYTIELSVPDDRIASGDRAFVVHHVVESADPRFNGIAVPDVAATVIDDDRAGVVLVQSDARPLREGRAITYSMSLASQPRGTVEVATLFDRRYVRVSPASIVFTTQDWNVSRRIRIFAIDDHVPERTILTRVSHRARSADSVYEGITVGSIRLSILDDDARYCRLGRYRRSPACRR